jgi:hypothetical protein
MMLLLVVVTLNDNQVATSVAITVLNIARACNPCKTMLRGIFAYEHKCAESFLGYEADPWTSVGTPVSV